MKKLFVVFIAILLCWKPAIPTAQATMKSREEYEKTGHIVWEANPKEKIVSITFDDGPHSIYTPIILDVLAKYNAKSTFFVLGEHAERYPEIIQRQIKEGHEVANHTYKHTYGKESNLQEEIERTADTIERLTGNRTGLFRPVGGKYNDLVIQKAGNASQLVVMWSWHQDTHDWRQPGVKRIVTKVTSGIKPGDVILMHDAGGNRWQTIKALDQILKSLTENGYEVVTVSELFYRANSILPDMVEQEFKGDIKQLSGD